MDTEYKLVVASGGGGWGKIGKLGFSVQVN